MAMDSPHLTLVFFFSIGLISLLRPLFSLLKHIYFTLTPPKDLKSYGSWALVTGATDGIGKALAFQLAGAGLNLLLVGRSSAKLHATASAIAQMHGTAIQIRTVVMDLGKAAGEEIEAGVRAAIGGVDVGVVVNNAGVAYPYARFFHEVDKELAASLVGVNVGAATWVTKAVFPIMLGKGKGAIVNVGSGSSECLPSYPLYSAYAATKAYLAMFSRCLSLEYKNSGIDIQCQVPFLVATKMASIRKASLFVPSAEDYAKHSLRWVGKGHACIPYWPHFLQACLCYVMPDFLLNWLAFNYFVSMRARGLRKDARKNKGNELALMNDRGDSCMSV